MHQDCVAMARYMCENEYGFERIFLCLESGSNSEAALPGNFLRTKSETGQSRITRETPLHYHHYDTYYNLPPRL